MPLNMVSSGLLAVLHAVGFLARRGRAAAPALHLATRCLWTALGAPYEALVRQRRNNTSASPRSYRYCTAHPWVVQSATQYKSECGTDQFEPKRIYYC